MGQTLSEPVTTKNGRRGQNDRFIYGASDMQGWRTTMEDSNATHLELENEKEACFFAVYDGHGGSSVAKYAGENCHHRVVRDPEFTKGNYRMALKNGFLGLDDDIRNDPSSSDHPAGCTSVALLVTKDNKAFCANAGDSRCVLSSKGVAVPLSFDHKPGSDAEATRIQNGGGFVIHGRVNGVLALSRAFGDFQFKGNEDSPPEDQIVTANPDIMERDLISEDEFVILACDGIWDVMSNQEAVNFVRQRIAHGVELDEICNQMMDRCLASDPSEGIGGDNMTVIIVGLLRGEPVEKWRQLCSTPAVVDGQTIDPTKDEEGAGEHGEGKDQADSQSS